MAALEERIYDANRAKEVLENPAFEGAFGLIEQELVDAWKTSPQRDEEGRQRIFVALTMLRRVKASLQTTLETGKLAMKELEHKQSLAQRLTASASALFNG